MNNLKKWLKLNKVSQTKLAEMLGIKKSAVCTMLKDGRKNIDILLKLRDITGLSIDQLYDLELFYNTFIFSKSDTSKNSIKLMIINLAHMGYNEAFTYNEHIDTIYLTVNAKDCLFRNKHNYGKSLIDQKAIYNFIKESLKGTIFRESYLSYPEVKYYQ